MTEPEFERLFCTPDVITTAKDLLAERLGLDGLQALCVLTRYSRNRNVDVTAAARLYVEDVLHKTSRN